MKGKTFKRFEDILAWQLSREVVREIYRLTNESGLKKDFALRDQITRSSVSVMSNIAEGYERVSNKEFVQFLNIARGSNSEVKSQLYVMLDVGYIDEISFNELYNKCTRISKILLGLIKHINDRDENKRFGT